ncbi:unnamed protein product [Caenorhabditis brenneri]
MDVNSWNRDVISNTDYITFFLIWQLFEADEQVPNFPIFLTFIIAFLCLLRSLLEFFFEKINFCNLEQCLKYYKNGLGCISVCGVVPFLAFLVFGMDSMISSLCFHVSSAAPSIFLNCLILPTVHHCDFARTRMRRFASNMKTASAVFSVIILPFIFSKELNLWPNQFTSLLLQIVWVLTNFPYYIEFWEVAAKPFILRNKILINPEDLECNVCALQYSDKRVPLFLPECGHSFCEQCLKAIQEMFSITCPFCRTKNFTGGPAEKLPRNFAILGIVQRTGQ